jgi:hypothetical protein
LEKTLAGYSPEEKREHFFNDAISSRPVENNHELGSNESSVDMHSNKSLSVFDQEMASNTLANLRMLSI